MKLFNTNKDIIFWIYITIYFILAYISFLNNINIWIYNIFMISMLSILTVFKLYNKKFNKWLNKKI